MSIVLSGFSATGKSTLGPLVAREVGLPFLDLDEEIARRTGSSIPALWRARGERAFRSIEREVAGELLRDGVQRVLAFGGGTVTCRETRRLALEHAVVVTLTAGPESLRGRLGAREDRPALEGLDAAHITELFEQRASAYAECHLRVITDELSIEEAAAAIIRGARRSRVAVPLGLRSYCVEVVDDAPSVTLAAVAELRPTSVVVVTDDVVRVARAAPLRAIADALKAAGTPVVEVTIPTGETHKTLQTVSALWDAALAGGIDRHAVVLAMGGGVVGDLAGFAASTLLRGVRVVQAPTTLLAMVDASVGGKTGFDHPRGKNLLGSFHQPSAVVADVAHLTTLPRRLLTAGLAEVAKIALTSDERLWEELESRADDLARESPTRLASIITRCVTLKSRIVSEDELETGARLTLNFGHTVGHAVEALSGFSRLHGEAVAIGIVAELEALERLGLGSSAVVDRARTLLRRLGLPTELPASARASVARHWASDKKRVGDRLRLPCVRTLGAASVEVVTIDDFAHAVCDR